MRKVFSSTDVSETMLVRDALVRHGVEATIQNEYSGNSVIPAFRPPAEVWIQHDGDYKKAREIVVSAISTLDTVANGKSWVCSGCGEESPQSFDVCWNCGQENDKAGGEQ